MLEQENKTIVEQSTAMLDNNNKVSNSNSSVSHNNPLSDHDYCSSQWIASKQQPKADALSEQVSTGREKRQRKEVHDPEFSQFTSSSEYSSSDAESGQESDDDPEDDPNRPWCTCERPDDGNFMLECDICKYWFHGSCVGMTSALLKKREKQGKEWFCSSCDHALQSGAPRHAIPLRMTDKKEKKSATKTVKRRGRPRKSATATRDVSTRQSLRSTRRSNPLDSSFKSEHKSNARVESFKKFDDQQRLRELIRERRKEFFRKHRFSEQLKIDKTKETGSGRVSLIGPLGQSLDSLATSTSSPNMNNLPINIRTEHKDRSKPNIVLQINTKRDGGADAGSQRIVKTIVKDGLPAQE